MAEILMLLLVVILGAAFLVQLGMMLIILLPDYLNWSGGDASDE